MNYKNNKSKFNTGFTLVETLVAIMILMASVVLPMSIYSNSITSARSSGSQVTAYYLAQDAMEFIKYKVATNLNKGDAWFDGGLPNCDSGLCTIDSVNNNICSVGCDSTLLIDSSTGLYAHNTGSPSVFSRTVKFSDDPNEKGGLVEVVVSWDSGGSTRKVVVKEYMFKWR